MPVPNIGGAVFVAKQTAKGSPASTATFAHGVGGGKIVNVERERQSLGVATALATELGAVVTADRPVVAFEGPAYIRSVGIWLLGLLGSDTPSGNGPYVHTMQLAAGKPYLTVWGERLSQLGTPERVRVSDVRVAELGLEWDGPGPVKLSVTGYGCDAALGSATTGTPTVDERTLTPVLVAQGGTFKVDAVGTTPATAKVASGSIRVSGVAEPAASCESVLPADVLVKQLSCEVSLSLLADDLGPWREALTGTPSTTTLAAAPGAMYGAFEVTFAELGDAGSLKLEARGVAFACDVPDVDPGAGPFQIELSGAVYGATASDFVKATLTNQQASY